MSKSMAIPSACARPRTRSRRKCAPCRPTRPGCAAAMRASRRAARCGNCTGLFRRADPRMVEKGCRSAGIGCIECKQPVIDGILREQQPMLERAQQYMDNPALLRDIVDHGCAKASKSRARPCAKCATPWARATAELRRDDGNPGASPAASHPAGRTLVPGDALGAPVRPGGRVLDLACGGGRHARWFAQRGHTVLGVDRDARPWPRCRPAWPAGRRTSSRVTGRWPARHPSMPSSSPTTCTGRCGRTCSAPWRPAAC